MRLIAFLFSLALILLALIDGFEAIIVTRRVTHRYRFARMYYRTSWRLWRAVALALKPGRRRESLLSFFGPTALLGLFFTWVICLISGFALLHWSVGTGLLAQARQASLAEYLYMSGETFFTLGYGDLTPATGFGRMLSVAESGIGFGFLAVVISYLPVLSQACSQREVTISLLDARAGSPPTAAQALLRPARAGSFATIEPFLAEWERWSAQLLESHLSFPALSYYRSQHDNQSWLAALTTVLDTCALLIVGVKCNNPFQAQLTFGMARHAAVDLALVLKIQPHQPSSDRLDASSLPGLLASLRQAGFELADQQGLHERLAEIREMYEPFVEALSRHFLFTLPAFVAREPVVDNWQRSAWMKRTPGIGQLPQPAVTDEHF